MQTWYPFSDPERTKLFAQCHTLWGRNFQLLTLFKELGDLASTIVDHERGCARKIEIIDEMIDVMIAIEQVAHVYGISNRELKDKYFNKIDRVEGKVKNDLEKTVKLKQPGEESG